MMSILYRVYWFYIATKTNDHPCSILKQQKYIISYSLLRISKTGIKMSASWALIRRFCKESTAHSSYRRHSSLYSLSGAPYLRANNRSSESLSHLESFSLHLLAHLSTIFFPCTYLTSAGDISQLLKIYMIASVPPTLGNQG